MINKELVSRMFNVSIYVEAVIFCQLLTPYHETLRELYESGSKRFFVDEVGLSEDLFEEEDGYAHVLDELAEKGGIIVTGCVSPCDPWRTFFNENGILTSCVHGYPHEIHAYAESLDEAFEKLIKKGEDIRRIAMNEARRLQCLPPLKES